MAATNLEIANLIVSEIKLMADERLRDTEMDMRNNLGRLSDVSQSHVWERIDFYSRSAVIESAEIEAMELLEDDSAFIALYNMGLEEFVSSNLIEDYYEKGKVWILR